MKSFDAVIVGSGAGGGVAACVLAEAGLQVLLLERGRNLSFDEVSRDNLRNQRLSQYGHNAGPDTSGNPRSFLSSDGSEQIIAPHEGGYHNNAATVGGGTRVYGAQAWRFMPQDFKMATTYGVPEGSSLADWPVSYEDMEPYYHRAEQEMGVCGSDEGNTHWGKREAKYPMPRVPKTLSGKALDRGAEKLGWCTHPVPLLINSVPYNNRPACVECKFCVGFACPSNSKNGTHNTVIPRALATGRCDLVCDAMVEKIETNRDGRVIGVSYIVIANGTTLRQSVTSKLVICSGGAVESARLLLNSRSDKHPHGLGNEHDQVGRHFQGHYYPGAFSINEEITYDGIGPGPSIATTDFNHGNQGIIGGGMLANDFVKLPIMFWKTALPPELPKWGAINKNWMRDNYRRYLQVMGPVQEIPSPDGRVTVSPNVSDKFGIRVAQFSGTQHPETVRTSEFMRARAVEWLEASGAKQVWSYPTILHLSGGQHQAGTCRMGDDPRTSVTDRWGRVHNHDNLYVLDGSLHVTNGGFNPVLTILALAFRGAEHIASNMVS